MVKHELLYKPIVGEQIRSIVSKLQTRAVVATIMQLQDNPVADGGRKLLPSGLYRIRAGDWRIIYTVRGTVVTILTIKDGHRKETYAR